MLSLIVILLSISAVFIIQTFNYLLQVENSFLFSFHVSPLEVHTNVILLAFTTYMHTFQTAWSGRGPEERKHHVPDFCSISSCC